MHMAGNASDGPNCFVHIAFRVSALIIRWPSHSPPFKSASANRPISDAVDEMPPAGAGLNISKPTAGFSVLFRYPSEENDERSSASGCLKLECFIPSG